MFDKLAEKEKRYDLVSEMVGDPAVINNQEQYRQLMKEFSEMEPVIEKYREYKKVKDELEQVKELLEDGDDELKEMAQMEFEECKQKIEDISAELKVLLLPKDENDDKNVIIEIRGGAGGDEASLFAANLFRAYSMYAEKNRWTVEIIDANETELGGFKEIVFSINGKSAYSKFKFESGVHRVQRVPATESSGRIHTSTITVAVLPEVEDVDIEINPSDLEIDTYRASGAGGQHVNKTESAIRITHVPSGIVVTCQDERSQHKNRDKALKVLRSKLYTAAQEEKNKELADERKSQVGTGDRSERIRTYNFPQGRVTDHRINLTLYKIEQILDGDFDEIFDALISYDQVAKLGSIEE